MNLSVISIIVPLYNAEKHLKACINSILLQSYASFELLLINDGSSDKSAAICEEYALEDERVHVFHQENSGVSAARNLGLQQASGQWITFIDADDWIEPNFLRTCMDNIHFELVISPFKWALESQRLPSVKCREREEIGTYLLTNIDSIAFNVVWGKLYKREILVNQHLHFDTSISSGEDTVFFYQYLQHIQSMAVLPEENYHYRIGNSENTLSKKYSHDWDYEHYILKHLLGELAHLEMTYTIQLQGMKSSICMGRFNKYLFHLFACSLADIKRGLSLSVTDELLRPLWFDKQYVLKGEHRKIFNWLVRTKRIGVLSVYVKLTRKLY